MSERVVLELGGFDFAVEQVNETLIPKISNIDALNALMKNIKYGFYSNEKEENVTSSIDSRMDKEYHLQAPETTIQKGIGLCWDTVLVAKYYLNKLGFQTKMFYTEDAQDPLHHSTHTFLFYKELLGNNKNVKWHWYEWSWEPYIGQDYNTDTWEELLKNFVAFELSKSAGRPIKVYAVSGYPKIGCGPDAFVDQMHKKGKLLGIMDAQAGVFNPVPVQDKSNMKQVNPVKNSSPVQQPKQLAQALWSGDEKALEDYFEQDTNGNTVIVVETLDSVFSKLDTKKIYAMFRTYVDTTLDESTCEHILKHYIGNCLQHQWWVRYFTSKLAEFRYYGANFGQKHFLQAKHLRILHNMYNHDDDKLHRDETIAAYAIRVYNQHASEGMDEVHELPINDLGKKAINDAWKYHVVTQKHHPEHWDRHYTPANKDLPDDQLPPCNGRGMPEECLVEMIGDWMSASLLRHKTAQGWYDLTVGKRFIFTEKQCEIMKDLLSIEDSLVADVAGKNPFATEAFGEGANTVPADIHTVNVIGQGTGVVTKVTKINPVTGEKAEDEVEIYYINPATGAKEKVKHPEKMKRSGKDMPGGFDPEFDPEIAAGIKGEPGQESMGIAESSVFFFAGNSGNIPMDGESLVFTATPELAEFYLALQLFEDTEKCFCSSIDNESDRTQWVIQHADSSLGNFKQSVSGPIYQIAFSDKIEAKLYSNRGIGIKNPKIYSVTKEFLDDHGITYSIHKVQDATIDVMGSFNDRISYATESYDPPYTEQQMRDNGYSEETISMLKNDPVHAWRMKTGIELIHREPSKTELKRIWTNWKQMTDEQKKQSDAKCQELFGCTNEVLYKFLLPQYTVENPAKGTIKYPSKEDLATEALEGFKTKKQRIIDYVVGCMDLLDPTHDNSRRFSDMVNAMDEKQFGQYINLLKEHKTQIDIIAPNMVKNLQNNDIFAAAHKIGCKLFDRVWFYDMTTGKEFLSTEELPIFRISVRRQEQMLDEKMSVPNSASKIDSMTGQVSGDDRAGGFSQPEIQIMYSKGFKNVLKEFVKIRGGDVHAFSEFERQLEETGSGAMDQIKVNSRARSGAVLATWLEAIHLENNV